MPMSVVYTNFGGQIVSENRGGTVRDYMPDTLGSTIALLDENQNMTDVWEYWPYGEVASRTGTNPTPFTYVGTFGYHKDITDKLFYVRARYLMPNYTQWATVDPIWPEESAYGYAGQAPNVAIDPTGTCVPITRPCSEKDWEKAHKACKKKHGTPAKSCIRIGVNCCGFEFTIAARTCHAPCPPPLPPRVVVHPPHPRGHYMKNLGCCCFGPHTHTLIHHVGPPPTCRGSWEKQDGVCLGICLPGDCKQYQR